MTVYLCGMASMRYWLFRWRSWWRWYSSAKTRYDVHSPLLADFVEKVVYDRRRYHVFDLVREMRKFWKAQDGSVKTLPQGAGSKIREATSRRIPELVRHSAISPACGEFLTRTALWCGAGYTVELGTNAGISGLYLHYADRRAELHTVEGNPEIAGMARHTFLNTRCSDHLYQYIGTFSSQLPIILDRIPRLDLLFIDGDHRYEATLHYLRQCLPKTHEKSLLIVADIHWSADMERAWEEAKRLPGVTASLDVYHFGVLFLKAGLTPKQHLSLVRTRWKPWRMGFF